MQQYQHEGDFVSAHEYEQLVQSLERPRKLMLMVKAGEPVDAVINSILPYLEEGDIIIDGGNSAYQDTQRRFHFLKEKGIEFIGCGVSGGEEGALLGPSLMPGGTPAAWEHTKEIFEAIAAKDSMGAPCVTHIGEDGAGHYVKMVHNGIEYGVMQLLAETYEYLHLAHGRTVSQIADIFASFGAGKLSSYLFEIMVDVLKKEDEFHAGSHLVEYILDKAGQKGTGKWTSLDALERGVAIPTLTEAVFARYISAKKELRTELANAYQSQHGESTRSCDDILPHLEQALYGSIFACYAQGYELIQCAAKEEHWTIDLAEVSRIWQGGCIIRAEMLRTIADALSTDSSQHLLQAPSIVSEMKQAQSASTRILADAADCAIPMLCFGASASYVQMMTSEKTSAYIIQGLRDRFGSHTYERTDRSGTFHTDWE
jgi:6-phosphogluconate dehydrogenase